MKKTLFVVAMAAILIIALGGTALAAVNRSGQQRVGAAPVLGAPAMITSPPGIPYGTPVAGAGTFTYMDWSVGFPGNSVPSIAGVTPHGNYTTTTMKCVVCHSVHYAAPGDAPVSTSYAGGGTQEADTLLRMRAENACAYCHASAGQSVNGRPVYGGVPPNPYSALTGHVTGSDCSLCHVSVHGDPQDTSVASLSGYLLRKLPQSNIGSDYVTSPTDMIEAIDNIDGNAVAQGWNAGDALGASTGDFATINNLTLRNQAIGIFCSECHAGSYTQVAAGVKTNVASASPDAAFTGHRVEAAATAVWNVNNDVSSSSNWSNSNLANIGAVAWKPTTNCQSCHDAPDFYNAVGFPHSWGGSKMWLMSAADAGSTETTLPINFDPALGPDPAVPQLVDGVCLRCHVDSTGTEGVGITF